MKASELRMGNLVNSESFLTNKLTLYNLIQIEMNPNHPYKPIPLTEEWLLKLGFEEDFSSDVYHHYHKEGFDMLKDYGGQGIAIPKTTEEGYVHMYCGYYDNEIDLDYVHQLQNLYFALTGEELTITE